MSLDVSKLHVHPTTFCPKSHDELVERATKINCSDTKKYICLPNEESTQLFEICFTLSTVLVKKGKNNLESLYSNILKQSIYGQRVCRVTNISEIMHK